MLRLAGALSSALHLRRCSQKRSATGKVEKRTWKLCPICAQPRQSSRRESTWPSARPGVCRTHATAGRPAGSECRCLFSCQSVSFLSCLHSLTWGLVFAFWQKLCWEPFVAVLPALQDLVEEETLDLSSVMRAQRFTLLTPWAVAMTSSCSCPKAVPCA